MNTETTTKLSRYYGADSKTRRAEGILRRTLKQMVRSIIMRQIRNMIHEELPN